MVVDGFENPEIGKLKRETERLRTSRAVIVWLGGLVILLLVGFLVGFLGGGSTGWTP